MGRAASRDGTKRGAAPFKKGGGGTHLASFHGILAMEGFDGHGTRLWYCVSYESATTRALLRRLRRKNVHIKDLAVRAKQTAQLLVTTTWRNPTHKELILRIRLTPVGCIYAVLRKSHLCTGA